MRAIKIIVALLIVASIVVGLYFLLKNNERGNQGRNYGGAFSFACSPGLGCHQVNEAPNKEKGLYSDANSCNEECHLTPLPKPQPTPSPSPSPPDQDVTEMCFKSVMENATSKEKGSVGMKCCNLYPDKNNKYGSSSMRIMCFKNSDEYKNCIPKIAKYESMSEEEADRMFWTNYFETMEPGSKIEECGICTALGKCAS